MRDSYRDLSLDSVTPLAGQTVEKWNGKALDLSGRVSLDTVDLGFDTEGRLRC